MTQAHFDLSQTIVSVPRKLIFLLIICWASYLPHALAEELEPITASGHGGFFDQNGKEIKLTVDFISRAQQWYRKKLVSDLSNKNRQAFESFEKRLLSGLDVKGQDALILQHQTLEWLLANIESPELKLRTAGKLRALRYAMELKLPETVDKAETVDRVLNARNEPFATNPLILNRIKTNSINYPITIKPLSATINSGLAYISECQRAGVPIPPPINRMDPVGLTGWKSEGIIPLANLFIAAAFPVVEIRSYKSSSPEGVCIALPRNSPGCNLSNPSTCTARLDGVICMGKQSSKVCFWDNQWTPPGSPAGAPPVDFSIPGDQQIPIGAPDPSINPSGKYQAGGKEIEFGPGNVCTDCHAGENPFIIHPKTNISSAGTPKLWETLYSDLPLMPINRYDPLVAESWPQNKLSQAGATVPSECSGCHQKGMGSAGRFPHLSNQISQYCTTILAQAVNRTMPTSWLTPPACTPGGANCRPSVDAVSFMNEWCNSPPNSSSADAGDPHITTINGVHYDFQAAGEFTVLKSDEPEFELQVRQSPVLTNFITPTNPHTGLASCASLNTAVALRVGKHRITYQPAGEFAGPEKLKLRIDGALLGSAGPVELEGATVKKNAITNELDVRFGDGARVVAVPTFWTSQKLWYIDIRVFNTSAREGVMGAIHSPDWLPPAPDGKSFGPRPVTLTDRHDVLNKVFANKWRVSTGTSLFDYEPGKTTADYTDVSWPSPSGGSCLSTSIKGPSPQVYKPNPDLAKFACQKIKDPGIREECLFDVTVMGDSISLKPHLRAEKLNKK